MGQKKINVMATADKAVVFYFVALMILATIAAFIFGWA